MKNLKIRTLLYIILVTLICFSVIMIMVNSVNSNIIFFDLKLFYSPAVFFNNVVLYTTEVKAYLIAFRVVDMVFPFALAFLFIGLLKKYSSNLIILPVLALAFDLSENVVLVYKMFINTNYETFIIYFLNFLTLSKFSFAVITILIIANYIIKSRKE